MPDDVQAILPGRVHHRKIWTIFYYQSEFQAPIRKIFFYISKRWKAVRAHGAFELNLGRYISKVFGFGILVAMCFLHQMDPEYESRKSVPYMHLDNCFTSLRLIEADGASGPCLPWYSAATPHAGRLNGGFYPVNHFPMTLGRYRRNFVHRDNKV